MFSQRITWDCQWKDTQSADFCAGRVGVITNFAVITNAVIKRVHCTCIVIHVFHNAGDIGELEGLRIELEDSRDMLEQEQRSKTQMERKLQELEQLLDDQKMDGENIQQTLTAKVRGFMSFLPTDKT